MNNIMLDLETLGTEPDSVILSIGAIQFDIKTGELGKEFYSNIDIQSCIDAGLTMTGSTIEWWIKQTDEAKKSLFNSTETLGSVLGWFIVFFNEISYKPCTPKDYEPVKIWANSPSFDCIILRSAFNTGGLETPWTYRDERDLRTVLKIIPGDHWPERKGIAHNAIDDCHNQIRALVNALRIIGGNLEL